jgi:DHA2 family multidrug resistance protein-like MFS transporter
MLGSLGVAIYRGDLAQLPAGLSPEAAATAKDTLGGAVKVAGLLPDSLGAAVLEVSRAAFVEAMQVAASISAVAAIAVALFAVTALRHVSPSASEAAEEAKPIAETDCFGRTRGCVPGAVAET